MALITRTDERAPDPRAERLRLSIGLAITLYCAGRIVFIRSAILQDPDIWWHIASGRWMWQHMRWPTADPFSHSFAGQPWIAKEWLSQILYFAACQLLGWNGVALLTAVALGLAAFALHSALSRDLAPLLAAVATVLVIVLLSPFTVARPHLLALPLLIVWTDLLFGASARACAPRFRWLAVLLLWANLHAAFTLGFMLAVFACLDFAERSRLEDRAGLRRWIIFLVLCPLVTLANRYGWQPMLLTWSVVSANEAVPLISEWQPFNAGTEPFPEAVLLGLVFASLLSGFRLGVSRALLLVLLLHLYLAHVRFAYVLFLALAILMAPEVARQFPRLAGAEWNTGLTGRMAAMASHHFRLLTAAAIVAFACLATAQAFILPASPSARAAASGALAFAKNNGLTGKVMNSYDFGGPLIFNGIPTFIDGRNDQLFLGGFTSTFMFGPGTESGLAEALRRYDIAWTLFRPDDPRIALLDRLPGWRRVFADEGAVIHQKQETAAGP